MATEQEKQERIVKVDGVDFIVRDGGGDCKLEVVNGDDVGQVSWHEATHRFRGSYKGWGNDAETVEAAVNAAARRIIEVRKGVSKEDACKAMEKFLED